MMLFFGWIRQGVSCLKRTSCVGDEGLSYSGFLKGQTLMAALRLWCCSMDGFVIKNRKEILRGREVAIVF